MPLTVAKAVVVTPDRDIETTVLEVGSIYQDIMRYDGSKLPRGVREKDTYLPRHSEKGRISPEEFRRLVIMGQRHHQGGEGRRRVSGKVDARGRVVHVSPEVPEAHADNADEVEDDREYTYLVKYRSGPGNLGEEVLPPADAERKVVDGKEFVLFPWAVRSCLCRRSQLVRLIDIKELCKLRHLYLTPQKEMSGFCR